MGINFRYEHMLRQLQYAGYEFWNWKWNHTTQHSPTHRHDKNLIFQFSQIIYIHTIFISSTTRNIIRSATPLKVRLQVPEWLGLLEIKWQNTTHSRLESRDMTATILPISTSDHFINDRTNKTPANTDFTRLLRFILIICDVVLFGCYGFPIRPKKCGNRLTACKQKYIFHFWLIIYKIFT